MEGEITSNVHNSCVKRWANECFNNSSNIGKVHFASIQGSTAFATSFPHIFGDDEKKTALIPAVRHLLNASQQPWTDAC